MPAPLSNPFSPSPETADRVIDQLADPDFSLRGIAAEHSTTIEALTLWLARPEIDERIANLESAMARRTRLISANCFPAVITTLKTILDEYLAEESRIPSPSAPAEGVAESARPGEVYWRPNNVYAHEQRRRSRETARRAAALLLRLARFRVAPRPGGTGLRPVSDSPSPREGAGGRVRSAPANTPTLEHLLTLLDYKPPTTSNGAHPNTHADSDTSDSEISSFKSEIPSLPASAPSVPSVSSVSSVLSVPSATSAKSAPSSPSVASLPSVQSVQSVASSPPLSAHDFANQLNAYLTSLRSPSPSHPTTVSPSHPPHLSTLESCRGDPMPIDSS